VTDPRHRFCIVLRGSPAETQALVLPLLARIPSSDVLWIGDAPPGAVTSSPVQVRRLLGQAFSAVVLDLHDGLSADVLGQCAGLIFGGGRLILRLPPEGEVPLTSQAELAVLPYSLDDVGQRFFLRFERLLTQTSACVPAAVFDAPDRRVTGDEEQALVVEQLAAGLSASVPSLWTLVSDRGRGKSSALGLALRMVQASASVRIAVSSDSPAAAQEIFRFATGNPQPPTDGPLRFAYPRVLATCEQAFDVIVIDEAAQLPVPLLVAITQRHPHARLAFATTGRGYEGTGRGFVLRFLAWAAREGRPLQQLSLRRPIRWDLGDPLEHFVDQALAIDAEPAPIAALLQSSGSLDDDAQLGESPVHRLLDRDALAHDEPLLRDFFGLLVHAHYRTTPSDLHRMLDAPNLDLHALLVRGRVVAASVVAREGSLSDPVCVALSQGRGRIRGHALPDTLMCHAGYPDAGRLSMVRSVRIAVHPSLRRRGLAALLVEHVHRCYPDADLFGTLFGATAELLQFRRQLGYELVRVGASRGSRTGEPAAVMIRPMSLPAKALCASLRQDLAQNLPLQLALLESDGEVCLDGALRSSLLAHLPLPVPLSSASRQRLISRYLSGPQPFDALAQVLTDYVTQHQAQLAQLGQREQLLLRARVLSRLPWSRVCAQAGYPSVPAALRALRPALRALQLVVDGPLPQDMG
jgi:tRNA(Met) cytidine acetyltransferase